MTSQEHNLFDVIVIGAGPAGMLAAVASSRRGYRTAILEKNDLLGKKLRLTGGGRCNVTTLVPLRDFLQAFGHDGPFLRQALTTFGPEELKQFLTEIGVAVYEEGTQLFVHGGGRKLVETLGEYLRQRGVSIFCNERVTHVKVCDDGLKQVLTESGKYFAKHKVIITTGGKTYPVTGSNGDGYTLAKELGLTVTETVPAMGSITLKDNVFEGLAGISLEKVRVEVILDGRRDGKFTGGLVITHKGLSGPAVLNASLAIARGCQKGKNAAIRICFFPDEEVQDTAFLDRLPQRLREMFLRRAGVDTNAKTLQITRVQRHALLEMLHGLTLDVAGTGSYEQAMVTVGGVSLKDIHPQTMESLQVKGVYFAGEVLDLAGACGGYNIQAAISTGYLAGMS